MAEDLDIDSVGALMKVADKYEQESLMSLCVRTLCDRLTTSTSLKILVIAHDRENEKLKDRALAFITKDQTTLKAVIDLPEFDELNPTVTRELLVFSQGSGKRKRQEEKEFPDGSNWSRLTFAQLQRACDERKLSTMGPKDDMVRRLVAETQLGS